METKKQDSLTYRVHDFLLQEPSIWHSVKDLCEEFFGEFTKAHDTAIREAIRKQSIDGTLQTIIISGSKGYKVAESQEELDQYIGTMVNTIDAYSKRLRSIIRKGRNHNQMKLQLGKYDSPIVQSIMEA